VRQVEGHVGYDADDLHGTYAGERRAQGPAYGQFGAAVAQGARGAFVDDDGPGLERPLRDRHLVLRMGRGKEAARQGLEAVEFEEAMVDRLEVHRHGTRRGHDGPGAISDLQG